MQYVIFKFLSSLTFVIISLLPIGSFRTFLTESFVLLCVAAVFQKRLSPPASVNGRNGQSVSLDGVSFSEGEILLQVQKQTSGLHVCTGVYLSAWPCVILYLHYFCRL